MSLSSDHSAPRTAQRLPDDAPHDKRKGSKMRGRCAQARCRREGLFPAPCSDASSNSSSGEERRARPRLCLEHAREANGAWNIFAGMSDADVERAVRAAAVGERPTWPISPPFRAGEGNAGKENSSRDFWQNSLHDFLNDSLSPFCDISRDSPRNPLRDSLHDNLATNKHDGQDSLSAPNASLCHPRTHAQREACRVMSLAQPFCAQQLKVRYRALAKAHHPDQHLAKAQRKNPQNNTQNNTQNNMQDNTQDNTNTAFEARAQEKEQQEEQERFKQINAAYALLQELLQESLLREPTMRKPARA